MGLTGQRLKPVIRERRTQGFSAPAALLLVLLLLAWAALPGCGRLRAAEKNTITIRSSFWGAAQDAKVWQELAREFERQHPNIRIQLEHIAGQDYHAKLFAMAVGRCLPDVMATDDEPFRFLSDNGVYEDLTPYLAHEPQLARNQFYTAAYDTFHVGKRQYALPYIAHCLLIYYNRDHRRAAGLPPDPKPNWTWEDFNHDAIALTRDLDGDGRIDQFGANRLSWFYCLQWIWGAGGTDMDPQMTRYVFDTPQAKRGFQFHYDQMHKYHICPMESDLPNMTWESMFLTGKVSMFMTGSWWLEQCRQAKNIDWDVAPMPRGPVCQATRATTEGLAISPQSPHKQEAWEWIKFVLSDAGQAVFARYGRGIPSIRRVAQQVFPDPKTPQHEERFLYALDRYAHITSIHAHWLQTARVFDREWDRVMMGKINIDQFVRISLPEVNAIVRGEDE
ncbi:MAG TPA: sugar ABC transporter substrate-binding protein [Chthonomonadaceae bacterium]|nr:sugar ABC transporter substrate-binding protein [Chthonomonadaceae bacterium]